MTRNVMWFRSDLRVRDNPALFNAAQNTTSLKAVYVICLQQWLKHQWGANKIGFVLANVLRLQEELQSLNISLDLLFCDYFKQVPALLIKYAAEQKCTTIFYNKEYELNEHDRDQAVQKKCRAQGVQCFVSEDQCLLPPGQVLNKQQAPYMVFTPFKKACYDQININAQRPVKTPDKFPAQNLTANAAKLPADLRKYLDNPILTLWPAGEANAHIHLDEFCIEHLPKYKQQRDFPVLDATSKLSAYLAVGAVSVKQCFIAALHANDFIFPGNNANIMCWIDELLWRDFYRNIIVHHPRICKGENYNTKYDHLKWRQYPADFAKWSSAQTGIPIIDAAMRQLVQTGWMHNRLRMIVAMFLTKQLLIDWRAGEEFFCEHLIDLDFASNNGGWQWCASTGTDAVPYFRIFNPITQSQKFDPQGIFIRKYCPELRKLDNKQIHDPSTFLTASELAGLKYPKIMVDLKQARQRALDIFKAGH